LVLTSTWWASTRNRLSSAGRATTRPSPARGVASFDGEAEGGEATASVVLEAAVGEAWVGFTDGAW
jgi:hypothetical protein